MSRLDTCIELMARDGIDALVLGREAHARTLTDVARLWLAGTRLFSPGCVVVRDGRAGRAHLLSNTDAVTPPGFPVSQLYGTTWNPEKLLASLVAIDGVSTARRIGVDGMTVAGRALLARAAPGAQIVDAGPLFTELWARPDPAKTRGVAAAATVARAGLEAMRAELVPGGTTRIVRGAAAAAFAEHGVTTPAFEAVAAPAGDGRSTWLPPDRVFVAGERVVLRAGVLCDGWEATIARTYAVGRPAAEQPPPSGWDALVAACAAGTTAGALRSRGAVVVGAGRGVEPWPDELVLGAGLVASLELRDPTTVHQDLVFVPESPSPTRPTV